VIDFKDFFLIPEGGLSWNYNFQGVKHNVGMDYTLKLETPEPFYAECHRPQHFLSFVQLEQQKEDQATDAADFENFLE